MLTIMNARSYYEFHRGRFVTLVVGIRNHQPDLRGI